MERRGFLKTGLTAALTLAGAGAGLPGCAPPLRSRLLKNEGRSLPPLEPEGHTILYHSALAPSGHNTQPWRVTLHSPWEWTLGSDPSRWLPRVDPDNRETLLSIGCFLENLIQAAAAKGYGVTHKFLTEDPREPDLLELRLHPCPFPPPTPDLNAVPSLSPDQLLERMAARRTVRTHFLDRELSTAHVNQLAALVPKGRLHYFPMASPHAQCMAQAAVDNLIRQTTDSPAMEETAAWTRLKTAEALAHRDGLTPDSMEITGLAGFYVRHFMDMEDVKGRSWKEKTVETIRRQAVQGAGYLVITSRSHSPTQWIKAGRRFQRIALAAMEYKLALHPMSQTLEEPMGQQELKAHHSMAMVPQFMIRVGYLAHYPRAVSLRRPVSWFTRTAQG